MIIYFLEANKLFSFKLPVTVTGSYMITDYDINGNKRNLVSVDGVNGKWIVRDSDDTKIYRGGTSLGEYELALYTFDELVVYGNERILMYTAPLIDETYKPYTISSDNSISISGSGADINFTLLGSEKMELTYKKGVISFENKSKKYNAYLNNKCITNSTIGSGDILFILGLRIYFMGNSLFINYPNGQVTINNQKMSTYVEELAAQDVQVSNNAYHDFYDEKDYYYKTPVFLTSLDPLTTEVALPSAKPNTKRDPLAMKIIPSAVMSISSILMTYFTLLNYSAGKTDNESMIMALVAAAVMLLSSIVWPFVERFYEKSVDFMAQRNRVVRYTKYLKKKEKLFIEANKRQTAGLHDRYLPAEELANVIKEKSPTLFNRNMDSDLFLSLSLGTGKVELNSNIVFDRQEYTEVDDELIDKAGALIEKYRIIENAPYSINLRKKKAVAFIGDDNLKNKYMDSLLLQIATYHSYHDLKLIILTDDSRSGTLDYLKLTKFCLSDDYKQRYYASNIDEALTLSGMLNKELQQRINTKDDTITFKPYYLIVSDSIALYRNLELVNTVLNTQENLGFGLIAFDSKINNIPDGVKNFVYYSENEANSFTSNMTEANENKFKPTFVPNTNLVRSSISLIANTPLKNNKMAELSLPESVGFLEMYGVGKIEQLNILKRWQTSDITNSLAAPVGIGTDGNIINLDLHEANHGPHGLVAGMTGSGKSEFIVTYLLSLALNYSPSEVQFVLIDYKGGGLAGAFENRKTGVKLPHLVGTITNLDKSEMKRTLVSINSELHRRQRLFNEAKEVLNTGTIDIYKYQQLVRDKKLTEPLAHLFIVCDEFAELKAQQPDFMDELVSTARIGRSLGVHLILATQKPSGVVDDQIWSNSKFKVCCKVQTTEDSSEMINRPDAAFLKEAGRFYLQVGYDQYFVLGQSGYSGRLYYPSDKIKSTVSTDINFINNIGNVTSTSAVAKTDDKQVSQGEELVCLNSYLVSLAEQIGFKNQQLWLPSIPDKIIYQDIYNKYQSEVTPKPFVIEPLIGEYDDPSNQKQGPVKLDLTKLGNIFINGLAGYGKSTMLSTIVYSTILTHSPEEVNFYIVDLATEALLKYRNAPQVSEVMGNSDSEKIEKLLYFLRQEIVIRKKHYAMNGGTFDLEKQKGRCSFPNIVVMINGAEIFAEKFEKLFEEILPAVARDSSKYGIYVILTGASELALGFANKDNFKSKIFTRLNEDSDYMGLSSNNLVPKAVPGRGIIEIGEDGYEFQTAINFDFDVADRNLELVIDKLNQVYQIKAPKLPVIPRTVRIDSFKNQVIALNSMPIGFEVKSACPRFYDFTDYLTVILYGRETSASNFLRATTKLFSYLDKTKNIVLSGLNDFEIETNDNIKFYKENFKAILDVLSKNFAEVATKEDAPTYIVTILAYTSINNHLKEMKREDPSVVTLDDLIVNNQNNTKVKFIVADDITTMKNIDDYAWYNLFDGSKGIILSAENDDQEVFTFKEDYNDTVASRDQAFVIENNDKDLIKFISE